jgi:hypothetical protein
VTAHPDPGPPPAGDPIPWRNYTSALPDARRGRRGYDKAAVDQLVARLTGDADHHRRSADHLRVSANAMSAEIEHRRGGVLPDHSLTSASGDLAIATRIDAQRQSDELLRAAQQHAQELVDAAQQHAAHLLVDEDGGDSTELRQRLRAYQQLVISMRDYLVHLEGVLSAAHRSFTHHLTRIDPDGPGGSAGNDLGGDSAPTGGPSNNHHTDHRDNPHNGWSGRDH